MRRILCGELGRGPQLRSDSLETSPRLINLTPSLALLIALLTAKINFPGNEPFSESFSGFNVAADSWLVFLRRRENMTGGRTFGRDTLGR